MGAQNSKATEQLMRQDAKARRLHANKPPVKSTEALSPARLAIELERQRLDDLEATIDIRGKLTETVQAAKISIEAMKASRDELEAMKASRDELEAMKASRDELRSKSELQPGGIRACVRDCDSACSEADRVDSLLEEFHTKANEFFESNDKVKNQPDRSVEELKQDLDACKAAKNEMGKLNNELKMACVKLEDKNNQTKRSVEKRAVELKKERLLHAGKGVLGALGLLAGVGLVIGIGISIQKYLSEELANNKSKPLGFTAWLVSSAAGWISKLKTFRERLRSIEECKSKLQAINMEAMSTEQIVQATNATMSEAQNQYDLLKRRLEERENYIRTLQENEQLKAEMDQLKEEKEENLIKTQRENERLKAENDRLKEEKHVLQQLSYLAPKNEDLEKRQCRP